MGDEDTNLWPKINPHRKAFWHCGHGFGAPDAMYKKINSVFCSVRSLPLKRIVIQFWRPIIDPAGNPLLACSGSPYALSGANRLLRKYRSGCLKYMYSLVDRVDDAALTISGAPPSRAARSLFPEVVLDLRVHRGTPLVDLALECELTCFMMLPVFHETQAIGLIEVAMRHPPDLLGIFKELKSALRAVGLSFIPPKSFVKPTWGIRSLSSALSEINKAQQMAFQSHPISVVQVWHPYVKNDFNGVLSRRREYLCKLVPSYFVNDSDCNHLDSVRAFYEGFPVLPLEKGQGLVGRTLETHRPHLCRNIYKSSDYRGALALLSASAKCTCFVICLRSAHSRDVDYVFEFFWPQSHNHLALMEALLLTLSEYLPSFKYASGAQLGDESLVVDVDNSSSGGEIVSTPIKIFPGKGTSKTPKSTRESVGMKRKHIDLHDAQSELNQANQHPLSNINSPVDEDEDDDDDLVVLAVYKVDHRLFFLPRSSTFENVMEKIKQEFEDELNPAETYKVEYQVVPGKWYSLTDDTCLERCILSYRASKNIDYIKFYVIAVDK